MKEQIIITHGQTVEFTADNTLPIAWAGFSLQSAFLWFMGRGMFRLKIQRAKYSNATGFIVSSEDTWRPMQYSGVARIGHVTEFRMRLVKPFPLDENTSMMEYKNADPVCALSVYAYGLADVTLDMFKRGATIVRAQYSVEHSQVMGNIGLEDRDMKEFADLNHPAYKPGDTIGDLP